MSIGTLYSIFKRDIDRRNTLLSNRIKLSNELRSNAQAWVKYLMETFNEAVELYESKGKKAALDRVDKQIIDFMKLDYHSLRSDSDILNYLREDDRFTGFVDACADFYESALNIKRLVFGGIENIQGEYVSMQDEDIRKVVKIYHEEVEAMHNKLQKEHNKLKLIDPK